MDKTIKIAAGIFIAVAFICAIFFIIPQLAKQTPGYGIEDSVHGNVTVFFFYGEECPHCHTVVPFILSMKEKYPNVDFQLLETWHNQTNWAFYQSLNKNLGVKNAGVPEVIIGNIALHGERDIPANLEAAIIGELKKKTINDDQYPKKPAIFSDISSQNASITALFFYGDGCSHCEKVKPLLTSLEGKYPELDLRMLEVYNNVTNQETFNAMKQQYGISNAGVPTLFIGNTAMIGELDISNRFEGLILAEKERITSCNETALPLIPIEDPTCAPGLPQLSLSLVIFAAIVDSANPCGLSILVFLLIPIVAAGSRKRILLVGSTYITAMFLFHLLVGIGLFSVFSFSGLSRVFALIGGSVALILGVITLIDVLRNTETFILSIPESKKGMLGNYIRIASLPATFILGILAGVFGFSCTGGIYISILALMGRDMTVMMGLPWLALYNFIYILPLILITLLVAYGIPLGRADNMRIKYKRTIRMVIGVILVALGVVILFGWMG